MFWLKFFVWTEIKAAKYPKATAAAFLLVLAATLGPFIFIHFQHLWHREHYQFFPMMLLALSVIGYARWSEAKQNGLALKRLRVHIPLILLCVVALAAANWLYSPWFGFLSAICLLLVLSRNVPLLSPVVWPLLILLPVPLSMDQELIHRLQRVSSSSASALLDLASVEHLMSGNVVEVADKKFFVEEACSGIGSVFLLLGFAAVYAVWRELRIVVYFPLLVASVGWAVAANTFRIFVVVWSHVVLNFDLSSGLNHEILGTATYLASLLFIVLTEQFLLFLFDAVPQGGVSTTSRRTTKDSSRMIRSLWNRATEMNHSARLKAFYEKGISGVAVSRSMLLPLLTIGFVLILVSSQWRIWAPLKAETTISNPSEKSPSAWESMQAGMFRSALPQGEFITFNEKESADNDKSQSAVSEKIWVIRTLDTDLHLSLRRIIEGKSHLLDKMESEGWRVLESKQLSVPAIAQENQVVFENRLAKDEEHFRLLYACEFHDNGTVTFSPDGEFAGVTDDLEQLLVPGEQNRKTWLFSMVIDTSRPIDDARRSHWFQSFNQLFSTLLKQWKASL